MDGHDAEIVEKLANNIIKSLLEHLLINVDAKGLLGEDDTELKSNVPSTDETKAEVHCPQFVSLSVACMGTLVYG